MMIFSLVIEGDFGGSGLYRRYQNVTISPYHLTEGTTVYFQFANTYGDSITLTWRLTNTKYQAILMYQQSFLPNPLIEKHIALPGFVFDGGPSQLALSASRQGFSMEMVVTIYPLQSYVIESFDKGFLSSGTITHIDADGNLRYEREQLSFAGMHAFQWHPYYGRFDWTPLVIRLGSHVSREIIFQEAFVLIADHPSLEGLPLTAQGRYLPLELSFIGDRIHISFPQLYVHPSSLKMSSIPLAGYVMTRTLFFPLEAYRDLKHHPFSLQLTFRHFHTISIRYDFIYQADGPFLGHCWQSQYCVRLYA
jgi:hypothetical protein